MGDTKIIIPAVGLAPFALTDDELLEAMDAPVFKTIRHEIVIGMETNLNDPDYRKRIMAKGIEKYRQRGDRKGQIGPLLKALFLAYITGQLTGGQIKMIAGQLPDYQADDDFVDDFPDFSFGDGE